MSPPGDAVLNGKNATAAMAALRRCRNAAYIKDLQDKGTDDANLIMRLLRNATSTRKATERANKAY